MLLLPVVIIILIFAGVIIILRKIFLSDTESAVNRLRQIDAEYEKKQQEIKQMYKDLERERESILTVTQEEVVKLKQQAQQEIENMRQQMLKDARTESDNIIAAARAREEDMRQKIYNETQAKIIEYAQKLLITAFSKEILKNLHKSLINDLIKQLDQMDISNIPGDIKEIKIVSAFALDEEREDIKFILTKLLKQDIEPKEEMDESLLAGVILYLGTFVIDASLSNYLTEATGKLKKDYQQ